MHRHAESRWPARISRLAAGVLIALVGLSGPIRGATDGTDLTVLKRSVINQYATLARTNYEDALTGARSLLEAVEALLERPSVDSLNRARHAWSDARVPYVQTEVYRFSDGPIEAVEGYVNAWPIDENLIDYVEGEPEAGIINQPDRFPSITRDLLLAMNERDGEKSITTGFHAVEFLLWGQDLNHTGPGVRPHSDYVEGASPNARRRRAYLRIAARLLVEHLELVDAEWAADSVDNHRSRFLALPPDEALAAVLKGAGILAGAELAGERLTVAYETKEQEDEHSCFSDTTHRDLIQNAVGIQSVFLGRYVRTSGERIEGPGLRDLLNRVDPSITTTLTRQIETSLAALRAIPPPFDQAIVGKDATPGRAAVRQAITSLRAQADSIARAGAALGLRLNF